MSDWSSGYVSDVGYTYGYYPELQPLRMQLPFLEKGLVAPPVRHACELGFGQGLSANIHAAASDVQWWGTDFNPAQAAFAQALAEASGADAHLFDQSFEDFCSRGDLPDFDTIGLHGIWSWISDENRRHIADFIRRKLRPGGVVYVSYNALPGWAPMMPLRHLLTRHADVLGAPGDPLVQRIDGALDFADALVALKPGYARANPLFAKRLEQVRKLDRHYLAHEYFNRDWQPMHFLDMAPWMQDAKLDWACSAHWFDLVDPVNLNPQQLAFLDALPDRLLREGVRDFIVNTQFRRDFWVKGLRPLPAAERGRQLRAQRVVLTTPRDKVTLKATTPLGEASLSADIYEPVLDALASHRPMTLGELAAQLGPKLTLPQLVQAVLILAGKGDVKPAQSDELAARVKPQCDRLNLHLMQLARADGKVSTLASPLLGGGFELGRFDQLFLLAGVEGGATAADARARWAYDALVAQGQRISHEGRALDDAQGREHLRELARKFVDELLPLLSALHIA